MKKRILTLVIIAINFAWSYSQTDTIMNKIKSTDISDFRSRQQIYDFIEVYRQWYLTKDIANIEKVFSNDALIITGTVIETKGNEMQPSTLRIDYRQQDKETYINNLKNNLHIGDDSCKVNIQFENINVVQHKVNKSVYGVKLRQHWNTTGYSDVGWLFLIIDFTNDDTPIIWKSVYQPGDTDKKDLVGLEDFPIK